MANKENSLLLAEGEEKNYAVENLFVEDLEKRDSSDLWYGITDEGSIHENNFYASGCKVKALENGELGVWQLVNSGEFDPEITQELATELIVNSGLNVYAVLPAGEVSRPYLLTELAFAQLAGIAGFVEAPALLLTSTRGVRNPMKPEAKAMVVNAGLATLPMSTGNGKHGKRIKYLVRDRAVRNIASGESEDGSGYVVLPFSQAVTRGKQALEKAFGTVEFNYGSISHTYDTCQYALISPVIRDQMERIFETDKVRVFAKFASSDCGLASLKLFPCGEVNGITFAFGKEISVEHKGQASIDGFVDQIPQLLAIINETAEKVEEMKYQSTAHPVGMFLRAAKQAGLNRKFCIEESQYLEFMTAHKVYDVWWSMNRVLRRMENENHMNQFSLVKYQTDIMKPVVFGGFEDAPFNW